jgi:hypothetical protein
VASLNRAVTTAGLLCAANAVERRLCGADQPVGLVVEETAATGPGECTAHAVAVAGGSRQHDGRSPPGKRLWHILVGRSQFGPLGL